MRLRGAGSVVLAGPHGPVKLDVPGRNRARTIKPHFPARAAIERFESGAFGVEVKPGTGGKTRTAIRFRPR